MAAPEKLLGSRGAALVAPEGEEVGTIEEVYLDRETNRPEWALVDTGLFGTRFTFVPLAGATVRSGYVQVPYGKDRIKGAPNIEPTDVLSQREEADLYAYYGLRYSAYRSDKRSPQAPGRSRTTQAGEVHDPRTGDRTPHSEEELHVGRARRKRGQVRLEKHVVTEKDVQTGPVLPRFRPAGDDFPERRELSEQVGRKEVDGEGDIGRS